MLDQNTDRMWYVIGAVLVGAAIILIANGTLPQMFASVTQRFETVTGRATDGALDAAGVEIRYMQDNEVKPSTYPRPARYESYDIDSRTWTLSVAPFNAENVASAPRWSGGLTIKDGAAVIPFGGKMRISYYIKTSVRTTILNDINNSPVEGAHWGNKQGRATNDNDSWVDRVGERGEIEADTWTRFEYGYTNLSPDNEHQVAIYDWSTFGAYNPTDDWMEIQIRDLKFEVIMPEESD